MNEHVKKILNDKIFYYIHLAVYIVFFALHLELIFDSKVRKMGYSLPAAIFFAACFAAMFIWENIFWKNKKELFLRTFVGLTYRVIQVLVTGVFYFVVPTGVGSGACLAFLVLLNVEMILYFPFDEFPRRMFQYVLFGGGMVAITIWRIFQSEEIYQGMNLFVCVMAAIFSCALIIEIIAGIYNYFIHLLFAQNRTMDNLNDANEKLKEQREQIQKTNELLGMQKVELQAANKKINRSHDEMSVQNEIAGAITATMEMEGLLKKVCRIMRVRLDMDLVAVVLEPDHTIEIPGELPEERRVFLSSVFGEEYKEKLRNRILSGEFDELLELSNTFIQNADSGHNGFNQWETEERKLESAVIVPLIKQDKRVGSLIVAKKRINAFMDNRAFYENIASQLNIGIANIRLYEQMHQMAIRDGLTRIYNRRHLTKLLNEYMSEAVQKKQSVTLALFDIDKFKMVNDTYGHPCGDAVICHVAALLNQAAAFHGGIAGRYGGEEFVIAFKGKTLEQVHEIVKEVHQKIKSEEVVYEDKTLHVRASAGIASYPETCKNPAELLTRADWAMYHSKRNGRDRITIDSDELETIM